MRNATRIPSPHPVPPRSWLVAPILFAALLLSNMADMAGATVLHVPGDEPSLQTAVATALPGDTVLVAPGTYHEPPLPTPHGPSMLIVSSGIVLRSEAGPGATVLDARTLGRTVYLGEVDPSTRLEGFTILGGSALGTSLYEDHGGGIFCFHSSPSVSNCVVRDNVATFGAGMACDHPSTPQVTDSVFEGNVAEGGEGGGVAFLGSSAARLVACTFVGNEAARGGGVQCHVSTPELLDCRFLDNHASEAGAAVHSFLGSPILDRCIFRGNSAPAGSDVRAVNGSFLTMTDCTLAAGSSTGPGPAGALSLLDSFAVLENCLVAFSESGTAVHCDGDAAGIDIACSDLFANADGDWVGCVLDQFGGGNISADPGFCDLDAGDLTLDESSPCATENNPECGRIGALDVGCAASGIPDVAPEESFNEFSELSLTLRKNPVGERIHVALRLESRSPIRIQILDVTGRVVGGGLEGTFGPGVEELILHPHDRSGVRLPGGIYFLRVRSSKAILTRSFTLLG